MVRWCVVLVDCNFVLEVARRPPIKIGWLSYTSLRLSRLAHAFVQRTFFSSITTLQGRDMNDQSCERGLKQALQGYLAPRFDTLVCNESSFSTAELVWESSFL